MDIIVSVREEGVFKARSEMLDLQNDDMSRDATMWRLFYSDCGEKPQYDVSTGSLNDTLCHHGAGHFHESGNVGSLHVVDVAVGLGSVFYALGMDILHDAV